MSPAIPLSLGEAASSFMSQPGYSERPENELAAPFLEYIQLTEAQKQKIEEDTQENKVCALPGKTRDLEELQPLWYMK